MSKITQIKQQEVIDQSRLELDYFSPQKLNSQLGDYRVASQKLSTARKTICIASSGGVDVSLLQGIFSALQSRVRVYLLITSFDSEREMLRDLNSKNPAVIREVPELKNDFIIVDGDGSLFLNSLGSPQNKEVSLNKDQSGDLMYWFNYYFWNCAEKEQICGTISTPKESPYPNFKQEKEHVSLCQDEEFSADTIIIPRDLSHKARREECKNLFLSDDVQSPLLFSNSTTKVGNLRLSQNLFNELGSLYELTQASLDCIDGEIIPFDAASWDETIQVESAVEQNLGTVRAYSIEEMESARPEQIPSNPYARTINCFWSVLPPMRSSHSQKAEIYDQYQGISETLNQNIELLERELSSILESKSGLINLFRGRQREAKGKQKKLNEWKMIDFTKLSINECRDKLKEHGEFHTFFTEVIADVQSFKIDIDRKAKEADWKERGDAKRAKLSEAESQLTAIEEQIVKVSENSDKANKSKIEKRELKSRKQRVMSEMNSLKSEIEKHYIDFKYNANSGNELTNLSKKQKRAVRFKSFILPEYQLPEVGTLYEDDQNYYLEIEDIQDLSQANMIAKQRYVRKTCSVVAKGA
jgi:hypothetical protein